MEWKSKKLLDFGSTATIIATFVFFAVATVEKGLTQELLLEAAVFLVSLKLIIASAKSAQAEQELFSRLTRIEKLLSDLTDGAK